VTSDDRPYLVPVVSMAYAVTIGAALLAIDQLAEYLPGPWFEVLGGAVLLLSAMTIVVLLRAGLRRHREGLERRALLWAGGAVVPAVLATLAIFSLVESAQNASLLSGADTHLTRPVIDALPRPPATKLVDEQPGLADTETIYQDFSATNLNSIVPFYEAQLPKDGWAEDKTSATASIVRFGKGEYILALEINPPSTYTLTVDHINPNLLQSPSPSPT
jgi:4-amino-4-deoxy-L-arabinose transferase-like glycosyltransferase